MAGELGISYTTEQTVKALIWGADRGTRWNGSAMVAPSTISDAAWATGMVAMTELQNSDSTYTGQYKGDLPATGVTGEHQVDYLTGASPTVGQRRFGFQAVDTSNQILTTEWYVSKSGNDSNGGNSWDSALLTVGAAVDAAASGDTINIGPGVFAEEKDASSAGALVFRGSGWGTELRGSTTATRTLKLDHYAQVHNMRITHTSDGDGVPLECAGKTGNVVENCLIEGYGDAINAVQSANLTVRKCLLSAHRDIISVAVATGFVIEDCYLQSDCEEDAGAHECLGVAAVNGNGIIRGCLIEVIRNDATAYNSVGVAAPGATGDVAIIDTHIRVFSDNAGATGDIYGIAGPSGTAAAGGIRMSGGSIDTRHDGSSPGNEYAVYGSSADVVIGADVNADRTKFNGTYTDLASAVIDWEDGGRLDLILDAILVDTGTTLPATLALIKTSTDLITSADITVTSAVTSDSEIELVAYDDYLSANSRALSWTNSSGDWFAGDISGAAVTLTLVERDGTVVVSKAGSVTTATGTQAVEVALTSAETGLFTKLGKQYKYQLLLVKTAYRETEVTGDVIVTLSNNEPS